MIQNVLRERCIVQKERGGSGGEEAGDLGDQEECCCNRAGLGC